MNIKIRKKINQDFFKKWSDKMSYVLGFFVADGCIAVSKDRFNRPFTFNITSADKKHLYKIRKLLKSYHKISDKKGGNGNVGYQLQIRNQTIVNDLMKLGIYPRKTYNLSPINIPEKYFNSFLRGFFDGDGSVYIYKVNNTPQIKLDLISTSYSFINDLNLRVCKALNIPFKNIHKQTERKGNNMMMYSICFYINDCEKLYKFMYKKASIYLERKYRIFKRWEKEKLLNRRKYIRQDYPSKIGWYLNKDMIKI